MSWKVNFVFLILFILFCPCAFFGFGLDILVRGIIIVGMAWHGVDGI